MRIPSDSDSVTRYMFFADLARKCQATQGERRRAYAEWKQYYMYGCAFQDGNQPDSIFNKIYPHIDTITSFVYAQDTTRFSVNLGASVSDIEYQKVPTLNRAVNDEWLNSNTDTTFGNGLNWSFVYGSTFIKPRWMINGIEPFVVDPHNFGVLREDAPELSQQEAYTHTYMMTMSQLSNELECARHPERTAILEKIIKGPMQEPSRPYGMQNIVTSASSPLVIGNVNINLTSVNRYVPRISEDLISMTELYVFDDSILDFRVVTMADPYVVIYDRPLEKMFLKNEAQYVQICPIPSYDYFWGISEVERLIPLQRMRNVRMAQIAHMLELQAQPPKTASGFPGSIDEMLLAMDTPAGMINSDMPGSKVETHSPPIPDDLFKEIDRIDQMFEEMSGIGNVLQGKGESGVRSTGHASQLLRSGSSRPKKRALIIEDSLEKLATLYLKIMQQYSDKRYKDTGGSQFVANQFTEDYVVKVDAHSNSPIFMEDSTQIAFELFKANAINREELLDLVQVQMRDLIKHKLKTEIEPAEAKQAEKQEKLEQLKLVHKGGG